MREEIRDLEQTQRAVRMHVHFQVQCAQVHEIDSGWGAEWAGRLLLDGCWRLYAHDRSGAAVRIGRNWHELDPGRCHLLPPGHRLQTRVRGRVQQLYLHVREIGPLQRIARACAGCVHSIDRAAELEAILQRCMSYCRRGEALQALCAGEACFHLAMGSVCASLPARQRRLLESPAGDADLLGCLAAMDADPAAAWSNARLAQRCGCHVDVFIRRFRRLLGSTPARWLIRRRLQLAAELLQGSDLSLDQIASRCGFSDRSHLIRRFRQVFACSPGLWRRQAASLAGPWQQAVHVQA